MKFLSLQKYNTLHYIFNDLKGTSFQQYMEVCVCVRVCACVCVYVRVCACARA